MSVNKKCFCDLLSLLSTLNFFFQKEATVNYEKVSFSKKKSPRVIGRLPSVEQQMFYTMHTKIISMEKNTIFSILEKHGNIRRSLLP